jgi:hypothetical protein
MPRTHQNTTLARVSVHTFDNGVISAINEDGFSPVVSFETDKRIGPAAGGWSVTLKGHVIGGRFHTRPWADLVDHGDWVVIDTIKNGVEYGTMIGAVDSVAMGIDAGGSGEGATTITLSGRDVGAPLENVPVYFNPWDPLHDNAIGEDMLRITGGLVGGRPHEFITNLIRGLFAADGLYGGHVQTPAGVADATKGFWIDMLDLNTVVQPNLRGQVFAPNVLTPEGSPSVWSFLDAWRNPTMNELFIDTTVATGTPRRAYVYLRERPFVNTLNRSASPWFRLPTHEIPTSTIRSLSLEKGRNRINHITVLGTLTALLGKDAYAIYRPMVDPDSIARYGVLRMEEQTRYFDEYKGDAGFESAVKDWLDLVVAWNALNAKQYQGQIVLAEMRPEIRIGHKVWISGGPPAGYTTFPVDKGNRLRAMMFYVEGVKHSYTEGEAPMASTVISVSRGYIEGSVVADTVAAHGRFVGVDTLPTGTLNELPSIEFENRDGRFVPTSTTPGREGA